MRLGDIEQVGWQNNDISVQAQNRVADSLRGLSVAVETLNIVSLETAYRAWRHLREYEGDYATYNGPLEHCLLEKTLEHFLSLVLINPKKGMTGMDVGSCKSVFPGIVRRVYGVDYYEQDLEFPSGVHGYRVGSGADSVPLPDASLDFITLHCAFEHFEGNVDTLFVRECSRLLKPGGVCVVLPLYLNESHCNVTGELDAATRDDIGWDAEAAHYCLIPEWKNRFGRHYSPQTFFNRVYVHASELGLRLRLLQIEGWNEIHPDIWLRWILVLQR